jgi:hypothetical protein
MDPLQVAARFTAFTAYLNAGTGELPSPEDAGKFAREHWKGFLPYVDQDLASFLTTRPREDRVRAAQVRGGYPAKSAVRSRPALGWGRGRNASGIPAAR